MAVVVVAVVAGVKGGGGGGRVVFVFRQSPAFSDIHQLSFVEGQVAIPVRAKAV